MAIGTITKDFTYQAIQLVVFAPVSALLAKTETVSRFIPEFETFLNSTTWASKLSGTWSQPIELPSLKDIDINLLSKDNSETVMIAATIGITTATLFQVLRRIPGLKNSPKFTFALSAGLSTAGLVAASKLTLVSANFPDSNAIANVVKNIFIVGGGITVTAKVGNIAREYLEPVLNFADLLGPVKPLVDENPDKNKVTHSPSFSLKKPKAPSSPTLTPTPNREDRSTNSPATTTIYSNHVEEEGSSGSLPAPEGFSGTTLSSSTEELPLPAEILLSPTKPATKPAPSSDAEENSSEGEIDEVNTSVHEDY